MDGKTNAGGGTSLNLKVIGGTTQPTSPAENTIWVNTSTSITSWVFSATQPTSPTAGMVWFNISTSSTTPINALKKNGLWVYPTDCQQYSGSAWVAKEAKTYQSGAWIDWITYLFKDGKYIKGQITCYNKQTVNGAGQTNGSRFAEIQSDNYLHIYNDNVYRTGMAVFPAVNVTNLTKLTVKGRTTYTDGNNLVIYSSIGTYALDNIVAKKTMGTSNATYTIDISGITGNVYVGFVFLNVNSQVHYYVSEVSLS